MTDIPLNSNIQLKQALTQLASVASDSAAARQAIEVVVRQLENEQISLSPATSAQIKAVLLPTTALQGTLLNGQSYQVKLSQERTDLLQFFSKNAASELTKLPLTEQLTQTLLKLPANQLSQLLSQNKLNFVTDTSAKSKNLFAVLPGAVANTTAAQVANKQILLDLLGTKPQQTITLPSTPNQLFQKGEVVNIEMWVKGKNWQLLVNILDRPQQAKSTSEQVSLSFRQTPGQTASQGVQSEPTTFRAQLDAKNQPMMPNANMNSSNLSITLKPDLVTAIIKNLLQQHSATQNVEISLALKSITTQLAQNKTPGDKALLDKVLNLVPEKISLQFKANGENSLHIQHPKLVANLGLTSAQLNSLASAKIIVPRLVSTNKPQSLDNIVQPQANIRAHVSTFNAVTIKGSSLDTNTSTQTSVSNKLNLGNENAATKSANQTEKIYTNSLPEFKTNNVNSEFKSNIASMVNNEFVGSKPAQLSLLQNLLRLSQPKAELPSTILSNIDKLVSDPTLIKTLSEQPAQSWLKQVVEEIRLSLPQGKEQDASNIKQLMSAPSLPLSAVQMITPPPSQGLLSGLVTLLQVSLASRLLRNQPSQAERLAQILPSIFTDSPKGDTQTNPSKSLQEFSQLEQKSQLIREISRLLADHQSNKLTNAEKQLQGQETYYYNLPSLFGDKFNNIELLVKREEHNKEEKQQNANTPKTWQLTMKLSVGELGELLTKAKLRPDQVEIDFYASNDAVKHQVMNFMPLLKRRLSSLGIEVAKTQCQLGKIPQTLAERPYHIFQTKA